MRTLTGSGLLIAMFLGCGDSGSSSGTGGSGGDGAGVTGGTGATGGGETGGNGAASATGGGGSTSTTGGGSPGGVVINEIQAHDLEWVEIKNTTGASVNLAGAGLCDEDANGNCDTAKAMRFPAGTTLGAGDYLVIRSDQDPAEGVGPHTVCGLDGVTNCFFASWKVSAVDGEVIRLIDGSDEEVSSLLFPAQATLDATQSWGRLPDGTGAGELCAPTPGAENQAP